MSREDHAHAPPNPARTSVVPATSIPKHGSRAGEGAGQQRWQPSSGG
jgi:hypothetical protein